MRTYEQCRQHCQTSRARKLANNTYLVERPDGGYGVRLHQTEVVIHYPDHFVLNSAGWKTRVTKDRINEFSRATIYSVKGQWVADFGGRKINFADGMVFDTIH